MAKIKVSDFDYDLPAGLIAQTPLRIRDHSRLMVLDRYKQKTYHKRFTDLAEFIGADDLIVINNSKVFPAKLFMEKSATGLKLEGLVLAIQQNNIFKMLIRNSKRLHVGSRIIFSGSRTQGEIIDKSNDGRCLVKLLYNGNISNWLTKYGHVPLPCYIRRPINGQEKFDKRRYQTIYAKDTGSIAAPTAGLHFTNRVINRLKTKGVKIAEITLHVGYTTFKPVRTLYVNDHNMDEEQFSITKNTAHSIAHTKDHGKRIAAVGTTVARALESYAGLNLRTADNYIGNTRLFIYPGYTFRLVDILLTNFHLPVSSLLMLVCAFGGREFVLSAYKEAVKKRYRFYSYGDAMLII